jgi:hypothetical protein
MGTNNIPTTRESSHFEITKLFIISFDIKGTVHFGFIPQGRTVTQAYHVEIPIWLHEAVSRGTSKLWADDWILHHDNAPAHKVLSNFWPKNSLLK